MRKFNVTLWLLSICATIVSCDIMSLPNDDVSIVPDSGNNGTTNQTIIYYTSIDGDIVEPDSNAFNAQIVENTYENGMGQIVFDKEITIIGEYAFYECETLLSIVIPQTITDIEEGAFFYCTSLDTINIPTSVETIGDFAFSDASIRTVNIPNSVEYIGEGCFAGCSNLSYISGKYSTNDNLALVSGDTFIAYAIGCKQTSYTIPNEVKVIGANAFGNSEYLEEVIIPKDVESINDQAFFRCSKLTTLDIPSSCTAIGDYAFADSSCLSSITCNAVTPPSIGTDIAYNNADNRKIYVPHESYSDYTSAWSEYANDIEALAPAKYDQDELDAINPLRGEVSTSFSGGTGTSEDPYIIASAADLRYLSDQVRGGITYKKKYFLMTNDIIINENVLNNDGSLNGDGSNFEPWIPIGRDYYRHFAGYFDGGDNTIYGLYFNREKKDDTVYGYLGGLFGYTRGAHIQSLTIRDSYFKGLNVASFVALAGDSPRITSCRSYASLSGSSYVGGIVSSIGSGVVDKCVFSGRFLDRSGLPGGIASSGGNAAFLNCCNEADIVGGSTFGGICGWYVNKITNCINKGNLTNDGGTYLGGIMGTYFMYGGNTIQISHCVNVGELKCDEAPSHCGEIMGYCATTKFSYCYFREDKELYGGQDTHYRITKTACIGYSDEYLRSQEFVDELNADIANQSLLSKWKLGEDGYTEFEWM